VQSSGLAFPLTRGLPAVVECEIVCGSL